MYFKFHIVIVTEHNSIKQPASYRDAMLTVMMPSGTWRRVYILQ